MTKRKQTRNKITPRKLLIIGSVLLTVSLCGFLAVYLINTAISSPEESSINSPEDNEETKEKKTDQKNETKNPDDKASSEKDKEGDKTEHINYEGENPNSSDELTGIITSSQISGESLKIRVSIDQFLSSGSCELTLKNSDSTYEDIADIFSDASTSTCEGFDVPVSNLKSGKWQINIKLTSGEKTGKIEGEVEI